MGLRKSGILPIRLGNLIWPLTLVQPDPINAPLIDRDPSYLPSKEEEHPARVSAASSQRPSEKDLLSLSTIKIELAEELSVKRRVPLLNGETLQMTKLPPLVPEKVYFLFMDSMVI